MVKNLILWVIIAIVLMSVFNNFTAQKTAPRAIDYSDFIEQVSQGQIRQVTISGNLIEGMTTENEHFSTYSPDDDGLIDDLIKHNV
jgi:cell division protease FtsH